MITLVLQEKRIQEFEDLGKPSVEMYHDPGFLTIQVGMPVAAVMGEIHKRHLNAILGIRISHSPVARVLT